MQFVINFFRLLIAVLVASLIFCLVMLILGSIPPKSSSAQSPPIPKDTVLNWSKEVIERFQAVSSKVDYAAAMVDSNSVKAQEIVKLLDRLSIKRSSVIKSSPRVIVKDRPIVVEVPKDTTLYYVEGQYINRPILIFDAGQYLYGGDTFRTNMWQPPNADGYWKPFKEFIKSKLKRNAK